MHELGIETGADLQSTDERTLRHHFGARGAHFKTLAMGADTRPVQPDRERKSVGAERTFETDLEAPGAMLERLRPIAERVAERLRSAGQRGRTVTLKIKDHRHNISSRQQTLDRTVGAADELLRWAERLLHRPHPPAEPVRLLGTPDEGVTLADSTTERRYPLASTYRLPDAERSLFLTTDSLPARPTELRLQAVADTSGNRLRDTTVVFTPPAIADTLGLRFRTFVPPARGEAAQLLPGRQPGLRFNQPVDSTRLRQIVSLEDTTGTPRPYGLRVEEGTLYRLQPDPPLEADMDIAGILGIDPDVVIESLTTCHEIRDRYTILGDGMNEDAAREVARKTGVI